MLRWFLLSMSLSFNLCQCRPTLPLALQLTAAPELKVECTGTRSARGRLVIGGEPTDVVCTVPPPEGQYRATAYHWSDRFDLIQTTEQTGVVLWDRHKHHATTPTANQPGARLILVPRLGSFIAAASLYTLNSSGELQQLLQIPDLTEVKLSESDGSLLIGGQRGDKTVLFTLRSDATVKEEVLPVQSWFLDDFARGTRLLVLSQPLSIESGDAMCGETPSNSWARPKARLFDRATGTASELGEVTRCPAPHMLRQCGNSSTDTVHLRWGHESDSPAPSSLCGDFIVIEETGRLVSPRPLKWELKTGPLPSSHDR